MNKNFFYVLFFLGLMGHSQQLPQFFSDNMVLQQNDTVPIWGLDKPGQKIQITTSWEYKVATKTNEKGEWRVMLPTKEAGGPYNIYIQGSNLDTIHNILLGEVWLAAGQSNMNIPLKGYRNTPIDGALDALSNADHHEIRFFRVNRNPTLRPASDMSGEWKISSPENAMEFSAVAYFFADQLRDKLDVPIGIITSSWGGSKVQAWLGEDSATKFSELIIPKVLGDSGKDKRTTPTSLYNGMISPLQDYAIKGFLWYQGESDRETTNYKELFVELIDSWRLQWHDSKLPFYFVQIAPFSYDALNPVPGGDAARVREAQLQTYLSVSGTGMVVTMDVGDCQDVHPSQKKVVGDRLAYWALADTYQILIPYQSPIFKKAVLQKKTGEVKVYFNYAASGFIRQKNLKGFYLSDDGKKFKTAKARISDDGNVLLSIDGLQPRFLSYGYGDCVETGLKNTYGLPAAPFKASVLVE
ncbi:sialate O-acetylesterase [Gramella sp. AN32]|uniref:Sialate O-acetylesterase n=1 Tax=Christiangramia antarctica TaxID=2058158 RepID=A0ABW5X1Y8_9FLAO|nr:sialate O-acetylesterase [Gramella sp. AN32]MCM4155767.1 sialate O-acetylesterase [Gramella sp. AN32]